MRNIIVTIDGPAAAGKERICKYICYKWKLKHLDSGILYRRLALVILKNNIDVNKTNEIRNFIKNCKSISFRKHKKLRTEKISKIASKIAINQFVRNFVNKIQRDFVNTNKINKYFVIDGRDIGSVVFKNAKLKLYIDVSEKNRAKRRYKQLIDSGEKSIYPQILKDIKLRDKADKFRKYSPLIVPIGAHIINNNFSFSNTKKQIDELVKNL